MPHEIFAAPGEAKRTADEAKRPSLRERRTLRTTKRSERTANREAAKTAKREADRSFSQAAKQARLDRREAKRTAKQAEAAQRTDDTPSPSTVRTVFALVGASAAAAFAIQAWMSYRFAKDVWDIPRPLCVSIIAMLDLFAVTFMVLTYLMRRAGWATQIYVWVVFAMAAGGQVYAAELYGAKEEWKLAIRLFSALPAIFLAAALHGLILWRNRVTTSAPVSVPEKAVTSGNVRKVAPVSAPVAQPNVPIGRPKPSAPKPAAKPRPAAPAAPVTDKVVSHRAAADRVITGLATAKDVAEELSVTPRAVQLWVKARRKEIEAGKARTFPQVNGHAFHADGPSEVEVN